MLYTTSELKHFFDNYNSIESYRLNYPDENVIRFLKSNFSNKKCHQNILDLGFGSGRHLKLLFELGFNGYGIDFSSVASSYVCNKFVDDNIKSYIVTANMVNLPFKSDFFDGIIEHATLVNNSWSDILSAAHESHRVLKKGGRGFFLLKRIEDCAFQYAKHIQDGIYISKESEYLSSGFNDNTVLQFKAFSIEDIQEMFSDFHMVKIHTWDNSFKDLYLSKEPNERRTAYWIVVVEK
ncbi:MAG: hypothetical protein CL734_04085 [Chloroflexi bacterium]|nr:hypothetical protein [Chloroflexota bacterium]